ncbi:MAG: hypothetical protein EZS28_042936 [Streblomastix strix]|uniref:Uncharacterized protein n=1 Tax=Streblomastix strix TaxID=222440 RepID=A0A5J4TTH7_9EUKA|nr:MAG: hypothetical protein EZS28_042936 [Streblomastix strix]
MLNYDNNFLLHLAPFIFSYSTQFQLGQKSNISQQQHQKDRSRYCLGKIQSNGDKQDQSVLINVGYGRVLIICISTAGWTEIQEDQEIIDGLYYISEFLRKLNNYDDDDSNKPSFPSQPTLAKSCIEQIEEEGGNEEVESQLINKGENNSIKDYANYVKTEILNTYINSRNPRPEYYQ